MANRPIHCPQCASEGKPSIPAKPCKHIKAMSKKVTLVLQCVVLYTPNGVPVDTLAANLRRAIDAAYKEGTLTGDTAAEVEAVNTSVKVA